MPTFICKTLFSQCIEQNANDARGQESCETNINDLCGTLNPADADVDSDDDDSSSTSGSASTTAAATASQTGDEAAATTSSDDSFAAPTTVPGGMAAIAALGLMAALV